MYFEPWLVTVLLESHASKLIFRESWEVLMDFLIFRVHSGYLKPRSRDRIWLVNWKWNGSWNFQRLVALSHLVEPLLLHMKPSSDISENILLQLHFTIHLMILPSHNRDLIYYCTLPEWITEKPFFDATLNFYYLHHQPHNFHPTYQRTEYCLQLLLWLRSLYHK